MAEWDHPFITLQKEFEQEQIKVFAQMASKGYIYKGLKPVYWCPDCKTALAEAEIEYAEDPCHSIYVKFKVPFLYFLKPNVLFVFHNKVFERRKKKS